MRGKRGRVEIIGEILNMIYKGETRKTRIMQGVFLGWKSFNTYMDFLLENELIKENGVKKGDTLEIHYSLTEKGKEVLKRYLEIKDVLKF